MADHDGWVYQGRQDPGQFGSGTKPDSAGLAAPRVGSEIRDGDGSLRGPYDRSFAWARSRHAAAQRERLANPAGKPSLLTLPDPEMGSVARERAQRRWAFGAEEFQRGEYPSGLEHLLLGAPFPREVDDPSPPGFDPADHDVERSEPGDTCDKPPVGSKPINEIPWSRDHDGIRRGAGATGSTKVKTSPADDVWVENGDGTWINCGQAGQYTGSGRPTGRRGKDRNRR